jgi:hypothetical protein
MYSLYNSANNFDTLDFSLYPAVAETIGQALLNALVKSKLYIYINIPYSTKQMALFNPIFLYKQITPLTTQAQNNVTNNIALKRASKVQNTLSKVHERLDILVQQLNFNPTLISFTQLSVLPLYFVCRRKTWSADCYLMQATNPSGTSIYFAFGGGDIVPFRLDAPFVVDKRNLDYMC